MQYGDVEILVKMQCILFSDSLCEGKNIGYVMMACLSHLFFGERRLLLLWFYLRAF